MLYLISQLSYIGGFGNNLIRKYESHVLLYGLQPVVEASKQQAYKNLDGMVPMEDPSVFGIPVPISKLLHHEPLKTASLGLQDIDIPLMHEGISHLSKGFIYSVYATSDLTHSLMISVFDT